MGHNRKNANRAAAINRTAKRVTDLEKEAKATRIAIQRERERHLRHIGLVLDRLEALERSTYAKARGWITARYRRWRPAYAAAELEAATGTETPAAELEAEAPAELEIVTPPTIGKPVPVVLEEHRQALEGLEPKPGLDPKPAAVKALAAVVTGLAADLEPAATPIDKLAHGMAKLELYKREHPRPELETDAGGTLTVLEPITPAELEEEHADFTVGEAAAELETDGLERPPDEG